jgi:SET domain-containing protein
MKYIKLFEEFESNIPELEVNTSNIPNSGQGLFTLVDIERGDLIAEFTGVEVSDEEMEKLSGPRAHYLVSKSDGTTIDVYDSDSPAIKTNDARGSKFRNNSEIQELENGEIWLVAKRRIRAGEEIFCDYGESYWENWS